MKILLVDDSKTMRRIQKNTLNSIGFADVVEAEDGQDALRKLSENMDVALILMDWNMPVMNGLECLKKIKGNPATKEKPVMMVTSEAEKAKILEAIQSGAANYVVKPFEPDVLEKKIKAVLNIK
jgi:two-component system, chemotaxis family, chemotaxis protein CheY